MDTFIQFLQENIYWVKLGTIPFVAGFIGWLTNWQAIEMTFKPLRFIGLKLGPLKLGWQGIIPAKGPKMAAIGVDLMTQKLLKVEEIFERLDPEEVARQMAPQMRGLAEKVVNNAMERKAGALWKRVPDRVKKLIFDRTAADIPQAIVSMLNDVRNDHARLLDFKSMYVEALLRDPRLLSEIFMKCGKAEFNFIIRSGWYFGFIFGIPQMIAWHFYPASWTLPVAGVLVGYLTNWLALKMIFEPKEEKRFLFWKVQGLFIKRQMEVSEEYANIVATKVLTSENIWEYMLDQNKGEALYELMEKHVEAGLRNMTAGTVDTVATVIAPQQFLEIRSFIIKDLVFRMPANLRNLYGVLDRSFNLKVLIRDRMQAMSPDDFVGVLRPAFQEEEWILIGVGALLGGIAGFAQWALVFGGLM